MSFETVGSSVADSILQTRTTQPKSRITAPPLSGPDSGVAPANLPGVIKRKDFKAEVCVDLPAFIQRVQLRRYKGAAATGIGSNYNYAYCLSDTVPQGRYWEVIYASASCTGNTAIQRFMSLFLIPPGPLPPPNNAPYGLNNFFEGTTAAINNGPPVGNAVRVDEISDSSAGDAGYSNNGEATLIKTRKLIVPQGYTLMVYGGADGFGNGGALGEQYQLRIMFAEFLMSEDTEIF